ncbi:hypothetical protein HHI36_021226 [Cryptolaemus montrouzieri]|uniref:Uncharacterized protein n=1 Tax=Cryptolaemus montrouzieri TaxID=559131 RepID=A0ABD2MW62_9CUCU
MRLTNPKRQACHQKTNMVSKQAMKTARSSVHPAYADDLIKAQRHIKPGVRTQTHKRIVALWQARWQAAQEGSCTRYLIPNLVEWTIKS